MTEIQSEDEVQAADEPVLSRAEVAWAAGLSAAVFIGLWFVFPALASAFSALLFFAMALITLADLRHFIIPDVLSLPAIPAGLVANAMVIQGGHWQDGLLDGLTGAVAGAGAFYLMRWFYQRFRGGEGLGLGDVKLAGVAGAWLGAAALAPACLAATLAALAGVLIHALVRGTEGITAKMHIPFGSFIAPTIFAFWILRMMTIVP